MQNHYAARQSCRAASLLHCGKMASIRASFRPATMRVPALQNLVSADRKRHRQQPWGGKTW